MDNNTDLNVVSSSRPASTIRSCSNQELQAMQKLNKTLKGVDKEVLNFYTVNVESCAKRSKLSETLTKHIHKERPISAINSNQASMRQMLPSKFTL
jgi:hypothetical protein